MQNTGRPCVGLKGTVVSLLHCEQVAVVSTPECVTVGKTKPYWSTAITRMIDAGVPLPEVAKIAGHEKHTTTVKHYVSMDKDMTRKVGDTIAFTGHASDAEQGNLSIAPDQVALAAAEQILAQRRQRQQSERAAAHVPPPGEPADDQQK